MTSEPNFLKKTREEIARDIEKFIKACDQRLRELDKEEREYIRRRKPIPEKLYHVTTRENAREIMKEGLDPSRLYFEDRDVVSLSDDIEFAVGVARITRDTTPKNLVVLEIDTTHLTPSRIHNFLRIEDPENPDPIEAAEIHEVHYESTISPEAIKIIKPQKKK